jgi:hypothetical protein
MTLKSSVIIGAIVMTLLTSGITVAAAATTDVNSDDTIENDIPPDGEGLFCDHPSNPGSCYDRNDNPVMGK